MTTDVMFTCAPCDGTGTVARPIWRRDRSYFLRGDLCPVCGGLGETREPWHPGELVPLAAALRPGKGEVSK